MALINSDSSVNITDRTLVKDHHIPCNTVPHPRAVTALDGCALGQGILNKVMKPIPLVMKDNHYKIISFFRMDTPAKPLVLGYSWLVTHQPSFKWSKGLVVGWGDVCQEHLPSSSPKLHLPTSFAGYTFAGVAPNHLQVPSEYTDLREVFSKSRASNLPSHHSYDLAIDLLLGTTPPRGRLYSLSKPETKAMDKYITETLTHGLI